MGREPLAANGCTIRQLAPRQDALLVEVIATVLRLGT